MCKVVFRAEDLEIAGLSEHDFSELSVCVRYEDNLGADIEARYYDWLALAIETYRKENNEMDDKDFEQRLTRVEERAKSNSHRLDEIEKDRKELSGSLNRMASAVEVLATEQKHTAEAQKETREKLEEVDEKVSNLEQAPAKSASRIKEKVIEIVIAGILGAIIGAICALIFK